MTHTLDILDPGTRPDPELLDLIQAASTGPPYDYAPGEVAPASSWVPDLVRRSVGSLVARDACGRLVGYCLVTRLADHPGARDAAPRLGVPVESTCYLAELGVAADVQHQGLGGFLVEAAVQRVPAGTTAVVVRTLVEHETAIRLYERCGFRTVPQVRQTYHGRPRLYLLRELEPR